MRTLSEFLAYLRSRRAPRVLTTQMMYRQFDLPRSTFSRRIKQAAEAGLIDQVREGVFLNAMSLPAVALAEATPFVRSGAVVSLHTVLGDAGVLNNFTPDVMAIIPIGGINSRAGVVESRLGRFLFRRMRPELLYAGDIEDRLDQRVSYLRATPEKALIDWIILGNSPHSTLPLPSAQDLDVDELNEDRLWRLAKAADIERSLELLCEQVDKSDFEWDERMRF